MIRIDEIYYNTFVKALQHQPTTALHWFSPFGSKAIEDLVSYPLLDGPGHRIIFWDQEPLYRHDAQVFFDRFCEIYRPPREPKFHTTTTLVTSELNSEDVAWIQDTYKIENVNYYFFHGWAALDWYRGYDHSFLSTPYLKRNIQHPLFIPNNIIGGRRQHRIKLLALLQQRNSIIPNRISFPKVCPYENISAYQLAEKIGLDITDIDLPLTIDHNNNHAGDSHRIDFWNEAQECFCHVVTETAWNNRLHITEKTFKPIVMQQPFILVGSRNGLAYLRDYGFQTFSDIWDESYDSLPDHERIESIADLCETITQWSPATLKDAHHRAQQIVEHNFRWFYNGGFQDILWKELIDMIDQWR